MKNDNKKEEGMLYLPIFMCIGISIGVALGAALGNIPLYMSLGVSIGVGAGTVIDAMRKKDSAKEDSEEDEDK